MTMKVIVLGGGPGGYVAALKAAILGAETVLIEKDTVGGTCLNRGCIPTKSLLHSAGFIETLDDAQSVIGGLSTGTFEYEKALGIKNGLVGQLVGGVQFLLKKRGVKLVKGVGKLKGNKTIEVTSKDGTTETMTGDAIILATGSKPVVHPDLKYDGKMVITSDEVLNMEVVPKHLAILGGGVIGCEFGQFFQRIGCKVTIIELADSVISMEDTDASVALQKALVADGVAIHTGVKIDDVQVLESKVAMALSNGEQITADKLLISVGRKPNIDGLGLEEAGIKVEKGKVVVDDKMETSVDGIYAIGDIVNTPALAHVASREGIVAVENAMGRDSVSTYNAVPRCIYTEPEIACTGMTEEQAKKAGIAYTTGKFPMSGIGKAMVIGKTEGFVKIITDENDVVIGGVIVGANATDMISELTLAISLKATAEQVGAVIHPHPTISESIMEALHDVHGESVHSF